MIKNRYLWKKAIIVGGYFGIFQGLMPIIGYFLGTTFENLVTKIDHWIAFGLLVFIGINMLKEAFGNMSDDARIINVNRFELWNKSVEFTNLKKDESIEGIL